MPLVNKQGRLLATEAEQKARWVVHFSEVQNRQPPTIEAEVQDPDTDLNVSTAPSEKDKIMPTIRSLKNGKDTGQDPSRQSQSLQHKFFSQSLQQYGKRNNYLTTGQGATDGPNCKQVPRDSKAHAQNKCERQKCSIER